MYANDLIFSGRITKCSLYYRRKLSKVNWNCFLLVILLQLPFRCIKLILTKYPFQVAVDTTTTVVYKLVNMAAVPMGIIIGIN